MKRTNQNVAVGVFDDQGQAQQAIRELKQRGFTEEQIGVVAKHDGDLPDGGDLSRGTEADTGAGIGAATGIGVGGLWGLGILAGVLPVVGPAIAGGALATILTSAVAGAAAGGLLGALVGMGIPEDEAEFYKGEFERGSTIVTVRADHRYDEARDILQQFSGSDVHSQRETSHLETIGLRTKQGQQTLQ